MDCFLRREVFVRVKLPKLDPVLKEKWVSALKSGEFRQTTGSLCRTSSEENQYCCLGVLGSICGLPPDRLRGHGHLSEIGIDILGPWHGPGESKDRDNYNGEDKKTWIT